VQRLEFIVKWSNLGGRRMALLSVLTIGELVLLQLGQVFV
jgi:hypothetical protein